MIELPFKLGNEIYSVDMPMTVNDFFSFYKFVEC